MKTKDVTVRKVPVELWKQFKATAILRKLKLYDALEDALTKWIAPPEQK